MHLNLKLSALDQIYEIYDNFISGLEVACKRGCAHCCTTRVTLTTIEGYYIINQLPGRRTHRTLGGPCNGCRKSPATAQCSQTAPDPHQYRLCEGLSAWHQVPADTL